MGTESKNRPTWAEIDLGALGRNLAAIRERAGRRRVIAVVKAGAYGHGAVEVSRALAAAGCEALAVATLEEAEELYAAGSRLPLLLLEGVQSQEQATWALERGWRCAAGSLEALEWLSVAGEMLGAPAAVHLKFDTGMGRLGFDPDQLQTVLSRFRASRGLRLEGVMSHLANADQTDSAEVAEQRGLFAKLIREILDAGWDPDWIHLDNSAAVLHGPTKGTNAVRAGLALYGADPTAEGGQALEPVMSLRTRVIHAKTVPAGTRVGYGGTYVAKESTRILTLPIGYADGLPWRASPDFSVALGEKRVPMAGRISMDLTTLDAGADSNALIGEEILVFGRLGKVEIRVEELAAAVGTLSYEILVGIGPRVPRVYRNR